MLQLLHCLGRARGQRVERGGGSADVPDRDGARFEREAPQPANGGAVIAPAITVAQDEANAERVVQCHLGQLTGRTENQQLVAGLKRPPEASVRTAVTGHEHMFA